jgi:alkaline phosphatase D
LTHDIYTTILKEEAEALFFLHMGDLHYEDLNVDSVTRRLQALDRVMNSDTQRQLFSHRPMVYMWDDHDWLGNNAGGDPDELGREAAL